MDRDIRITLVQTSYYAVDREWLQHDHHEMIYALSEGYVSETPSGPIRLSSGQVALYGAGLRHRPCLRADGAVRFLVLHWSAGSVAWKGQTMLSDRRGRLLFLLRWMWEIRGRNDAAELARLLGPMEDECRHLRQNAQGGLTAQLISCLEEDYRHPLTMQDLAGVFGLSTAQLVRRFKAETGLTPAQYLQQLRITKALALLQAGQGTVQEIAEAVGLGSAANLSRLIRRETGRPASHIDCR